MGSFVGSVVLSIIAVGCLNYLFAKPLFSFRVDYPNDIFAIAGFFDNFIYRLRSHSKSAQGGGTGPYLAEGPDRNDS